MLPHGIEGTHRPLGGLYAGMTSPTERDTSDTVSGHVQWCVMTERQNSVVGRVCLAGQENLWCEAAGTVFAGSRVRIQSWNKQRNVKWMCGGGSTKVLGADIVWVRGEIGPDSERRIRGGLHAARGRLFALCGARASAVAETLFCRSLCRVTPPLCVGAYRKFLVALRNCRCTRIPTH